MEHQFVSFKIQNEEYAVDILSVQEINRMTEITKVPKTPEFIEGVINLRGKVIPVINLRKRFGLPEKQTDNSSRIIVLNISSTVIGIVVDSVSEVLRVPDKLIEPPPMTSGVESNFINGIGKLKDRLIMLLDMDRLLTDERTALASFNQISYNS